jgi:hypothetical protein
LADIHIKNNERHIEYLSVFNTLIKNLTENIIEGDIIYVGGDIFESKIAISNEARQYASYFLKSFGFTYQILPLSSTCNKNFPKTFLSLTPFDLLSEVGIFFKSLFLIPKEKFLKMS